MSQYPLFPAPNPAQGRNIGAFEPINIYDAPGVMAAQLLEGEATLGSIKDVFLSPDRLSPQQRTDLADRFTQGGDSVSKALLGVVSNPWVWAMFLTSPVGAKAMAKSGGSIFNVLKEYASQSKSGLGFFSWGKTLLQEFDGTAATPVALGVSGDIEGLGVKAKLTVAAEKTALINKMNQMARDMGGKGNIGQFLSSAEYPKGTPEHELLRRWEVSAAAYAHGLHQDKMQTVLEGRLRYRYRDGMENPWVEKTGEGLDFDQGLVGEQIRKLLDEAEKSRVRFSDMWDVMEPSERAAYSSKTDFIKKNALEVDVQVPEVVSERVVVQKRRVDLDALQQELDQFGPEGWAYLYKAQQARKASFVEYIGDEAHYASTGEFKPDKTKVVRLASSLGRSLNNGRGELDVLHAGSTSLQGKEMLLNLMGKARFSIAQGHHDTEERTRFLFEQLEKIVTPEQWDQMHLPRNTYQPVKVSISGKMRMPPVLDPAGSGGRFDVKNMEMAPWSSSSALNARVVPLTEKELVLDPEDMEFMLERGYGLPELKNEVEWTRRRATKAYVDENGRSLMGLRLSHDEMHERYLFNMHIGTAYDTRKASASMIAADSAAVDNLSDEVRSLTTEVGGAYRLGVGEKIEGMSKETQELITPGVLMDRLYVGEKDAVRRAYVRNALVPGAFNNAGPEWLAAYDAQLQTKKTAKWFSDSLVGRTIEGFGEPGKKFIGRLREIADPDTPVRGGELSHGLARWFYASHLGLNLSSMMLNMTQPLLLAATVGNFGEVVGAYKDAFLESADYARKRTALGGVFVDPAKKLELMRDSFKFMGRETGGRNVLGIGPDMHHIFDWQLTQGKGGLVGKAEELMMKGFEKTEWFNRNVAAHLFERVAKRGGRVPGVQYIDDLHRFVQETQFGATALNTPRMFREGVMANPLLRQFFTFPLRSAVGALSVFPKMGEEKYMRGLMNVTLRGMGMSAIVYEMGKGLMGADLSRGLYAGAVTDLVGGERLTEKGQGYLPVPPVMDVPVSMIQGIVNEDTTLLANSVARMIPGGVAINRVLGITGEWPQGPQGLLGALQKTWVDWEHPTPDGLFPVFKADGTLIDYQPGSAILARGLGVDMGQFQEQGSLDNYLNKQREDILEARRAYLRAMASNEVGRATAIQKEFLTKHGIPLTVNERQVKDFLESKGVSRPERILDRMPPEVRGAYQQMVAASGVARNVPRQQLTQGGTSGQRERTAGQVSQDQMQELMRRVEATGPAGVRQGPFSGFQSY